MPGSVQNRQQVLPVPAGTEVPSAAISGTGDAGLDGTVAPYTFLKDATNPAGTVPLLGVAQDGTDSTDTNATQAAAGVGIRGWLSTLVSLFRAGSAKVQVTSLPAQPAQQSAAAALTSVASSTSSVVLLAANSARKGVLLVNDSTSAAYVAFAASASTSAYSVYVPGSQSGVPYYWEMPAPPYTGALSAVWSTATGNARLTELS